MPLDAAFLARAVEVCGPRYVLTDPEVVAGQSVDWTRRYRFPPAPVVRPGDVWEVAEIVLAARAFEVPLVAQGGNTGLVGGSLAAPGGVVVDLRRLDTVEEEDPGSGQLTAGAGSSVERVQEAARRLGWDYGVDWAARQTATIGGSVATNAGGLRFLRHGDTRRQLLGMEAVLGTGEIISHLPAVAKDNTGYHLASMLCGSEGTLGMVTAVRVRLVPPAPPLATAIIGFGSTVDAVTAANVMRKELPSLEAVELMTRSGVELVCSTLGLAPALDPTTCCTLLVEVAAEQPLDLLAGAVDALPGLVGAAVASDGPQRRALWRLREAHTEAIATLGPVRKLDVTLPAIHLASFIDRVPGLVSEIDPGASTWCFGHAADGNIHVNVTGGDIDDERIDEAVLRSVADMGGSISAEHGIGRSKRRWLHLAQGPNEIRAMQAVKAAWDPDGICNPGVLFPDPM